MLHVSLLGEQVVSDGDGRVLLRSSRTIALVAFLVTHADAPQTRQRIAGSFWPDSTDEQALTNLRRELHHLRAVLHTSAALVVTSRDLCWRDTPAVTVDVRVFGRERRAALAASVRSDPGGVLAHAAVAVEHYGGEFLPGRYEDWVLEVRAELERQCVELLDLLRDARAGAGELSGAVDAARRRIQLRPLEETGYRALMELQADLGDRAGAVSTYHHCASVLERELGVEPDPRTRAVLDRLLARADRAVAVGPARGTRSGAAAVPLVGRAREYVALLGLWRGAAGGRATLAVVRGDAGVGKTRLVAEVAAAARRDGCVVANAGASAPPGGWPCLRSPNGCAARTSGPGWPAWTRSGGARSTGSSRLGGGGSPGRTPRSQRTRGSATASSRGSPAA